jgi:DNA-binding transcriptional ArsR family regulator
MSNNANDAELYELSELFKVLGDQTRVRIIASLSREAMTVGVLAAGLGMSLSAISHQLHTLKQARLVKPNRLGREVEYHLDDEHVRELFRLGLSHIKEKSS